KAQKKNVKVFILGKDIEYPLNFEKIRNILISEINDNLKSGNKNNGVKNFIKSIFTLKQNKEGKHIKEILNGNNTNKNNINRNNTEKIAGKNKRKFPYKSSPTSVLKKAPKETDKNKPLKESLNTGESSINILKNIPKTDILEQKNSSENIITDKINQNQNQNIDDNDSFSDKVKPVDYKPNKNSKDYKSTQNPKFNTGRKLKNVEYQIKTIRQKIIAVTKAKGGVGATVISIFLGLMFKELKTLLIDLNFNEGGSDFGYYLDIPKTPNLMVFTEGYDKNAFSNSVYNIIDNLDIIQSPPTYMQSKEIDLKDIYNLTDIARKKYDLIIFDLPNYINEFYLGIVDLADLLIMVSDCTTGSIGRLLNINSKYIYNELEKILIINKYNKFNSLKISIDSLKDYFNLKNITTLKEMDILNCKSDFKLFNFNNIDDFRNLSNIATEILTK
ncbi:MAG: AAA family ATPase, partial [Actinobacteria bacterium]|nr:AAA family ATPase [Actinomycetota bacterium]